MTKRILLALAAFGMLLIAQPRAFAQFGGFGDGLEGTYSLQTSGQAVLTNAGDCSVSGSVPGQLIDGIINLNGRGGISGSNLGISIGATSCTSPNFNISGSYTVQKTGDGTIEAT